MREGGKITAVVLKEVLEAVAPGVLLLDLEKRADEGIRRRGGEPAFERVEGYDFATCLNVNEGVVHGVPTERKLREGDLLSVDLGTYFQGFYTDASWTVLVGGRGSETRDKVKFLKTGERALKAAIAAAKVGDRVNDISRAMQGVLEDGGYAPVDALVGHGIGRDLHEDPQIPCLVLHQKSSKLDEGMTFAIEVIYTNGEPGLEAAPDGWTYITADRSWAGLFEHTVAITSGGPIILTGRG